MPQLIHSSLRRQYLWGEDAVPPFDLHFLTCAHVKGMLTILLHFPNSSSRVSQCAQETGLWQSGQVSSIRTGHCKELPAHTGTCHRHWLKDESRFCLGILIRNMGCASLGFTSCDTFSEYQMRRTIFLIDRVQPKI